MRPRRHLLRARRQELHRTAAQAIAAESPTFAEAQPEVIARHWSGAGDAERAFATWRKAGEVARSRNAFIEAREAYRHALDMLALTPPSPERDATELELLIATSQMIAATKGYLSPDRIEINTRAEALAAKIGNLGHLAEQIVGSWTAAVRAGNYPSAMGLADRLLDVARRDSSAFTRGLATSAQSTTQNLDWRSTGGRGAFRRGRSIPVGSGSSPLFCRCHYDLLCRHECRDHGSGRRGASANASRYRHDRGRCIRQGTRAAGLLISPCDA